MCSGARHPEEPASWYDSLCTVLWLLIKGSRDAVAVIVCVQHSPGRHERALANSARHASRAAALRASASPVRSRLGMPASPSRSPSRTSHAPPSRRTSSSPVQRSFRTTLWTEDASGVRSPSRDVHASGVRSHLRRPWHSQSNSGFGTSLEFEFRPSPNKLSMPSRAVVSGGVMERALALDSSPDTTLSTRGESTRSKYRIDVEALARQAALPVPAVTTVSSPDPRPADSTEASRPKDQSGSTARAVLANRITEQEHCQKAAAAEAELAASLGVELERAQELAVNAVGQEVSQLRGDLIPGYQLESYQRIHRREVEHQSSYQATDKKLQAQLYSHDQSNDAHFTGVAAFSSALRVGSPGRTGLSSNPAFQWTGETSLSRTRSTPPHMYSSPGRSSPGRSSPGRSSPARSSVSSYYGGGSVEVARRLPMTPGSSPGISGPSSFTHGSLSSPRRPGTTMSNTGRLTPLSSLRHTSSAATFAESMSAVTALSYGAVGQPEQARSNIASLPPRETSSASIGSTPWADGISGQLERPDWREAGRSPTRRRATVHLVASSPPRSRSSIGSPGRSDRRLEASLTYAGVRRASKSPARSLSSAGAAQFPSSPSARSANNGATLRAFESPSSHALDVDPKLTNMAANAHDRAAMDADIRFKEAIKSLQVRD